MNNLCLKIIYYCLLFLVFVNFSLNCGKSQQDQNIIRQNKNEAGNKQDINEKVVSNEKISSKIIYAEPAVKLKEIGKKILIKNVINTTPWLKKNGKIGFGFIKEEIFQNRNYDSKEKDAFNKIPPLRVIYWFELSQEPVLTIQKIDSGIDYNIWQKKVYSQIDNVDLICGDICLLLWVEKTYPLDLKASTVTWDPYIQIIDDDITPFINILPQQLAGSYNYCFGTNKTEFYFAQSTFLPQSQQLLYINNSGMPMDRVPLKTNFNSCHFSTIQSNQILNLETDNNLLLLLAETDSQSNKNWKNIGQPLNYKINMSEFEDKIIIVKSSKSGTVMLKKDKGEFDINHSIEKIFEDEDQVYVISKLIPQKVKFYPFENSKLGIFIFSNDNKGQFIVLNKQTEIESATDIINIKSGGNIIEHNNQYIITYINSDDNLSISEFTSGSLIASILPRNSEIMEDLFKKAQIGYISKIADTALKERGSEKHLKSAWLWEQAYNFRENEPRYLLRACEDLNEANYSTSALARIMYLGNLSADNNDIKRVFSEFCNSSSLKRFRKRTDYQAITGCSPPPEIPEMQPTSDNNETAN